MSAFNGRGNTRTAVDETTNHRFIYDRREIVTVFRSTRIVSPILDTAGVNSTMLYHFEILCRRNKWRSVRWANSKSCLCMDSDRTSTRTDES